MATYYLGGEFDIHCGGLIYVLHHETNCAVAAAGDGFASYRIQPLGDVSGEKMSKSLGNVLSVPHPEAGAARGAAVLPGQRALPLRPRVPEQRCRRPRRVTGTSSPSCAASRTRPRRRGRQWTDAFADAMNEDLAVPRALAGIHNVVRGNQSLADGDLPRSGEGGAGARNGGRPRR